MTLLLALVDGFNRRLTHFILSLNVSACFQEKLYNCGVAVGCGVYERLGAKLHRYKHEKKRNEGNAVLQELKLLH
jgi:hypothetical protein